MTLRRAGFCLLQRVVDRCVSLVRRAPIAVIRPALCDAIAARISGPPAIRWTSI